MADVLESEGVQSIGEILPKHFDRFSEELTASQRTNLKKFHHKLNHQSSSQKRKEREETENKLQRVKMEKANVVVKHVEDADVKIAELSQVMELPTASDPSTFVSRSASQTMAMKRELMMHYLQQHDDMTVNVIFPLQNS